MPTGRHNAGMEQHKNAAMSPELEAAASIEQRRSAPGAGRVAVRGCGRSRWSLPPITVDTPFRRGRRSRQTGRQTVAPQVQNGQGAAKDTRSPLAGWCKASVSACSISRGAARAGPVA
jgi:hypothetical protein